MGKYIQKPDLLRTHPIFSRLLQLKQALATLEDLDFDLSDSESESDEDEDLEDLVDDETLGNGEHILKWNRKTNLEDLSERLKWKRKPKALELDDLSELLREAEENTAGVYPGLMSDQTEKPKSKSVEKHTHDTVPMNEPPRKKRKVRSTSAAPTPVSDLVEPEFVSSKRPSAGPSAGADADAFGEPTALADSDAADKKARRRSLRFHTAKIDSTSARREEARAALGGDDDVPYRERIKARQERLAKEARTRGVGTGGDDLDSADPAPRMVHVRDENTDRDDDGQEDGDGYYSLVQKKQKEKMENKQAEYDAARTAERCVSFARRSCTPSQHLLSGHTRPTAPQRARAC